MAWYWIVMIAAAAALAGGVAVFVWAMNVVAPRW